MVEWVDQDFTSYMYTIINKYIVWDVKKKCLVFKGTDFEDMGDELDTFINDTIELIVADMTLPE